MTYWNGQLTSNAYSLQFSTDEKDKYKLIEQVAQSCMDQDSSYMNWIKLPCAIGQELFYLKQNSGEADTSLSFEIAATTQFSGTIQAIIMHLADFGTNLFLSYAEAEARLKTLNLGVI